MKTFTNISGCKAWQNTILDLMDNFDVEKLLERRDKVIRHVISRKVLSGIPVEDLKFGIANIDGIDWDGEWVENFRVESWKRLNPELAKASTEFMPAGAI